MSQSVYTNLRRQTVGGSLLKEGLYKPNGNLAKHFHENLNFCFVLKGGCTERLGNKTVEFKPLTLGLLAPGDEHSLQTGNAQILCFGIEPAPALLERVREHSLEIRNSEFIGGGLLIDLFAKIYREFRYGDSASPLAIEGLLLEMIVEAARRQPLIEEKRRPFWLDRAEELLREQYQGAPELSAVASAINIHPVHLARISPSFQLFDGRIHPPPARRFCPSETFTIGRAARRDCTFGGLYRPEPFHPRI